MLFTVSTDKTIEEVAKALESSIKSNQFGLMHVHNLKETMQKKGVNFEKECLIFEVCQPQQAREVLTQNMSISTALPCRISVYEQDHKTFLATIKPTMLLEMFDTPQVKNVAKDVEQTIIKIMKEAVSS